MPYVETVPVSEATGELRQIYERLLGGEFAGGGKHPYREPGLRKVANVVGVSSLRPRLLLSLNTHFANVMFGESGLSRSEREMIAAVVSWASKCQY